MVHHTTEQLEAGLALIRQAPREEGTLRLIVARPAVDARVELTEAELDAGAGLVGDTWAIRPSTTSLDGGPHPDAQVTVMGWRTALLLAGEPSRCALAGDQLYVDLDLGAANLPAGTRLSIGAAVLGVTAKPHTGCAKFSARFGADALRFVNSPVGRELRLRGLNARVLQAGTVRLGDPVLVQRDR